MSTQIEWTNQLLSCIKHINCILSDNEGSLFTFSQSCNRDKKENPHSHHLQLHHHCVCTSVLLVWKLSWKHFVWYYLVCHNARHFILAPKRFRQRVCQTEFLTHFWLTQFILFHIIGEFHYQSILPWHLLMFWKIESLLECKSGSGTPLYLMMQKR